MPTLTLNYPQANTDPNRLWYLVVTPLQQFTYGNNTYVPNVALSNTPKPAGANGPLKVISQNTTVELPATEHAGALLRFQIFEKTPPPEPNDPAAVLKDAPAPDNTPGTVSVVVNPPDTLITQFDRMIPDRAILTADDLADSFYGPTLLDGSNYAIAQRLMGNTGFMASLVESAKLQVEKQLKQQGVLTSYEGPTAAGIQESPVIVRTIYNGEPNADDTQWWGSTFTANQQIAKGTILLSKTKNDKFGTDGDVNAVFMALRAMISAENAAPNTVNITTNRLEINNPVDGHDWLLLSNPIDQTSFLSGPGESYQGAWDYSQIRQGVEVPVILLNPLKVDEFDRFSPITNFTKERSKVLGSAYDYYQPSEYDISRSIYDPDGLGISETTHFISLADDSNTTYPIEIKRGETIVTQANNDLNSIEGGFPYWFVALNDFTVNSASDVPNFYPNVSEIAADRFQNVAAFPDDRSKNWYWLTSSDGNQVWPQTGTTTNTVSPGSIIYHTDTKKFYVLANPPTGYTGRGGPTNEDSLSIDLPKADGSNVGTDWIEASTMKGDQWLQLTGYTIPLYVGPSSDPKEDKNAPIRIVPWQDNQHVNQGDYFFRGPSFYKAIAHTTMTTANDPGEPGAQWSTLYEQVWTVPKSEAPKTEDDPGFARLDKPNSFAQGNTFNGRLAAANPPLLGEKIDGQYPMTGSGGISSLRLNTVLNRDVLDSLIWHRLEELRGFSGSDDTTPAGPTTWNQQQYFMKGARALAVATAPGGNTPAPDAVLGRNDIIKLIADDVAKLLTTGHTWTGTQTFRPGMLQIAPDGATLDPSHQVPNKSEVSTLLQQTMTGLGVLNHGTLGGPQVWTGVNQFRGKLLVGNELADEFEVMGRGAISSLINQTVNSRAAELNAGGNVTAGVNLGDDNTWTGANIFEGIASFTGGATITNPSSGKAAILPKSEIETLVTGLRTNPNQAWTGTNTFTGHLQVNRALDRSSDLSVLNRAAIETLIGQKLDDHDTGVDFKTAHTWDALNTFSQGLMVGTVPDDDNAVLNRAAIATMISQHQVTLPSTVARTNALQVFTQGLEVSKAGTSDNAVLRRVDIAQMIADNKPPAPALPQALVYVNQANNWAQPQVFPSLQVEAGGTDDNAVLGRADIVSLINANKPQAQTFSTNAGHTWGGRQTFTLGAFVGQAPEGDNAILGRADIQNLIAQGKTDPYTLPSTVTHTNKRQTWTQPQAIEAGGLKLTLGGATIDGSSVLNKSSIDSAINAAIANSPSNQKGMELVFWARRESSPITVDTDIRYEVTSQRYTFDRTLIGVPQKYSNYAFKVKDTGLYAIDFLATYQAKGGTAAFTFFYNDAKAFNGGVEIGTFPGGLNVAISRDYSQDNGGYDVTNYGRRLFSATAGDIISVTMYVRKIVNSSNDTTISLKMLGGSKNNYLAIYKVAGSIA